jgi:hypothetical protein
VLSRLPAGNASGTFLKRETGKNPSAVLSDNPKRLVLLCFVIDATNLRKNQMWRKTLSFYAIFAVLKATIC